MLIEIRKAHFINKGAELMLRAIVDQLTRRLPDASLAMIPPGGYDSYPYRARLGLYQKLEYAGSLLPSKFRRRYGLVTDAEIDVVLDASGFSYSDQRGEKSSLKLARHIKRWKRQRKTVILMPQAFGPFTNPKIRRAMRTVIDHADAIYARERLSYDYLTGIAGECDNIRMAPDFTSLLPGALPEDFDRQANRFCLIPNYHMISSTSADSDTYIDFLATCARHLHERNARPFILVHEGEKDPWLAKQIADRSGVNIDIIQNNHALEVKGIIGASNGVISSRFHGLVSALSQAIPSLATGWSHKYEMLFEDYGFPEGVLSLDTAASEIKNSIDALLNHMQDDGFRSRLSVAAETQKTASIRMWDEIETLVNRP